MGCKPDQPTVLVIGVGNRFRGDDAAGPSVADSVCSFALPAVHVIEHSGEGASLMESWRAYDIVFLADAADSGSPPGFIREFDAREQPLPSEFFRYSTHAFSVAEAIEMARVLGHLPARLHVYAIEGASFTAGAPMSPEVARSVEIVAEEIRIRILGRAGDPDESGNVCTKLAS